MKSPFPGMDPYIEACGLWPDFHSHLIERIYDDIAARAPGQYVVRTGERSYIVLAEEEGKKSHPFVADVNLSGPEERPAPVAAGSTATAVAEPAVDTDAVEIRAFIDEHYRETFVEIYETDPELRLVTCIEVLSPTNKRPGTPGWDIYLRKRQALMLGVANLIEIDLLRGGTRLPMFDPWPTSPYTLLLCRKRTAPYCKVWTGHFQKPLPVLPVPLSAPDPDLSLALQPMIEAIYARSRYHRSIDYTRPAEPPLSTAEQSWLAARLQEQPG
jgi:hypothetical protein